jgi:hypothetical protein
MDTLGNTRNLRAPNIREAETAFGRTLITTQTSSNYLGKFTSSPINSTQVGIIMKYHHLIIFECTVGPR